MLLANYEGENQDGGSLEFDEFRLRVSSIYFFSKETVNCSINFMIKIIRCAIYCNLTSPEKIESFPSLRFFFFSNSKIQSQRGRLFVHGETRRVDTATFTVMEKQVYTSFALTFRDCN